MTPLACLTRGDSSPRGKARVYFCCHPDDQSAFLKPIADQILALQNCAVWYDPEPGSPLSPDRREELAQMQLFVVPVTSRFLTSPSPALTEEFPLALEQHIPVLPLLQEPGLESIFNEKCGDLQCLDPNQTDPTALPYAEKLKKFLDGVLVGDELAAQVRAAFDAYIFLSYRKKDRKEAQALMRLIHENEFCRDIAIWYDEFLTPGEDFNAAITQALEKSGLFVLAVTPHLLEKPNYVMEEEFPRARAAGKPILPVEMAPTDRTGLEAAYPGIPPCAEAGTLPAGLKDALRGLALREHTDPKHDYFIGLAYLAGIDVEVNKEKGAALIQSAARDGLPEAMEKLADMYRTGDGVPRDYKAAARWQRQLADARRAEWENKQDEASYTRYVNALRSLGDQYKELAALDSARKVWETEFLLLTVRGEEQGFAPARRDRAVGCERLGTLCQAEGDLPAARRWFEESLALERALVNHTGTAEARRGLSVSCEHLGNLCQAEGDLPAARRWFEESLELDRALANETGTVQARRDLSFSYLELGNLCQAEGDLPTARRWFEESLELRRALADETGTVEARRDLAVSCDNLGEMCRAEGDLPAARRWFEESLELDRALADETGTVEARRDLAASCNRLGDLCRAEGDLPAARRWFEESLKLFRALATETGTVQARRDLSVSCNRLGEVCQTEGDLPAARRWFEESLKLFRALARETGTVRARRDLSVSCDRMGDVCQTEGDLPAARRLFEESLELRRALAAKTGTVQARRDLAISCNRLGEVCRAEGDLPAARRLFQEGLDLSRALARETGTPEARDDLSVSLFKLGTLPGGDVSCLHEAYAILSQLAEECPSVPRYAQNLDILRPLILSSLRESDPTIVSYFPNRKMDSTLSACLTGLEKEVRVLVLPDQPGDARSQALTQAAEHCARLAGICASSGSEVPARAFRSLGTLMAGRLPVNELCSLPDACSQAADAFRHWDAAWLEQVCLTGSLAFSLDTSGLFLPDNHTLAVYYALGPMLTYAQNTGDLFFLRRAAAHIDSARTLFHPFHDLDRLQPVFSMYETLDAGGVAGARRSHSALLRHLADDLLHFDNEKAMALIQQAYALWDLSRPESRSRDGLRERALLTLLKGKYASAQGDENAASETFRSAFRQLEPLVADGPTRELQRALAYSALQAASLCEKPGDALIREDIRHLQDTALLMERLFAETQDQEDLSLAQKIRYELAWLCQIIEDPAAAHETLDRAIAFCTPYLDRALERDDPGTAQSYLQSISRFHACHARFFIEAKDFASARAALTASCRCLEQCLSLMPLDTSYAGSELAKHLCVLGCLPPKDPAALQRGASLYAQLAKQDSDLKWQARFARILARFYKTDRLTNHYLSHF